LVPQYQDLHPWTPVIGRAAQSSRMRRKTITYSSRIAIPVILPEMSDRAQQAPD
jgi:hypothetical protein